MYARDRAARVYKQNAITPVYTRLRSNWPHRDTRGYSTAKCWRIYRTALLFWYGNYPAVHFPGWLLDCCLADSVRGLPVNSVSRFIVVAKLAARRIRRAGSCHKTSLRTILTFSAGNPLTIIFAANAMLPAVSRCLPAEMQFALYENVIVDPRIIYVYARCRVPSAALFFCSRSSRVGCIPRLAEPRGKNIILDEAR